MPSWDPDIYERFKAERERPAFDLLLRIPTDLDPVEIWDLGCGAGEHAALLAVRHPGAQVHGLDSSAAMLQRARARKAAIDWVQADFEGFAPTVAPHLIFSNAALHWAANHGGLFPRLASTLAPGGVFACQMPLSHDAAWHVLLRETAKDGPWAGRLGGVSGVQPVATPEQYYDWLSPLCPEVDIWSTTYLHVLEGDDPIVEWMRGSGLRPYLDALGDAAEREDFLDAYRARLVALSPPRPDGTILFPFPRLFILARR